MNKIDQRSIPPPTLGEIAVLIAAGKHAREMAADCGHDFAAYLFDMAVETLEHDLTCPEADRKARSKLSRPTVCHPLSPTG